MPKTIGSLAPFVGASAPNAPPDGALWWDTDDDTLAGPSGGAGTVFPSSPVAGDLFFRTDLGYQFFWNSTVSRWLSTHVETYPIATQNTLAPGAAAHTHWGPAPQVEAYYLNVQIALYINTLNNASNYWTVQGDLYNGAGNTSLGNVTTIGLAAGVWESRLMTQNYLLAGVYEASQLTTSITGSPGSLYMAGFGRYRLALAV